MRDHGRCKANAYGHGDIEISRCLCHLGIHAFAVATIDEGIRLRRKGIKGEILILGYTPLSRAAELCHYRLSQTLVDAEYAKSLDRWGKPQRVHIAVNTGMNRLGENSSHVAEIASIFHLQNLKVEGIFTHLCVPDSHKEDDIAFSNQQIEAFYKLLEQLETEHIQLPKIHIQSSYGVLNYPRLQCDYARIGIALYGVLSQPNEQTDAPLDLEPVLALKSRVALVRTIEAGESTGYGREFIAQKKTRVAIIPIGFADGLPRNLSSGKGSVLIRGCYAPIVGRICMDQCMVDVTGVSGVIRGDIVTLIGRDGSEEIRAEQVATEANTITNELLSRLGNRLERVFLTHSIQQKAAGL